MNEILLHDFDSNFGFFSEIYFVCGQKICGHGNKLGSLVLCNNNIFFLSYSPLIITPLWGPYPIRVILYLGQVHPSQLLRHRLSVIADDVVVAVLVVE